jgi:hypothetical protein
VGEDGHGGPKSMSADELATFLAAGPLGALCVTDDEGRLVAVPARILDEHGGTLRVELAAADLASTFEQPRRGCVVADTFESYEGIRGVIARGPAAPAGGVAAHPIVALTMARTATFSFADDRQGPKVLRQ